MARVLTNRVETTGTTNLDPWRWKQITYVYWDISETGVTPTVVVEIYYGHTDTVRRGVMSIYTTTVFVDGIVKDNGDDFSLNVSCEPGEWQLMQTFEFPLSYAPEDNKTVVTEHAGHFAGHNIESKITNVELVAPCLFEFTNSDKEALEQNTAIIKCKLVVKATGTLPEMILTENDSVKNWTYTDDRYVPKQGFVGQFVARTLEGSLHNISDDFDIENRELELRLGVVNNNNTTWYSLGNFIVTDPEDDEVKDNTKFQAMDYTKLFNKDFDGGFTNDYYTTSYDLKMENNEKVTALWLAQYTCAQVGVELGQTNFTNADFEISQNPFKGGEKCRDVMKEIAKLAYSWVRIDWDNKCYFDFHQGAMQRDIDPYNVINNNHYFELTTKKQVYGPVNRVLIGMSGVDGQTLIAAEDTESIEQFGEHPIYIYDNPLTYTDELREAAANGADKLLGMTYVQLSTETTGHPWLKGNETIDVIDMEEHHLQTYAFNKTLKYSGHIKSTLDSMGDSEIEATLSYDSEILRDILNAKLTVDKANGEIEGLANRTSVLEGNAGEYYTKEETEKLILNAKEGLTNTYTSAGGNNKFRNTALYFREGTGFEYWDGSVNVVTETNSATQTAMLLQKGTVHQLVSDLANNDYTISFKYKKLNSLSTASVTINSINYQLSDEGKFEQTIRVDTNAIDFNLICDTNNGYQVYELMCNVGLAALVWTQHPDEIMTDTVNISKGIKITSTTKNAVFKADADGIRIENTLDRKTTEFTDNGMITEDAEIRGQAKVSGALFTKVDRQTWINGL